ncbi:MAG: uracil-DNA glycosylase [Ignavibacteria bacterium]
MDNDLLRNTLDTLDRLACVLQDERALLGEILLYEHAASSSIQKGSSPPPPKTTSVPGIVEEPLLFELSPNPAAALTTEEWGKAASLEELEGMICTCTQCALGLTRTKFVFGVGNPHATLMLIGEAPGADEDAQGEPFVGRAGQLLTRILEAINFKRSDVYICNILKCRPPNNRKPTPEESAMCKPYLKKQIELITPKVILCLGLTAAENLLGTTESMTRLRGRVLSYEGIPVMVTYHPAALLRNPNWKRPTWEDVQAVRALHDDLVRKTHDVKGDA